MKYIKKIPYLIFSFSIIFAGFLLYRVGVWAEKSTKSPQFVFLFALTILIFVFAIVFGKQIWTKFIADNSDTSEESKDSDTEV